MKGFQELGPLGTGGFGNVTKCKEISTGRIVAIKKINQKFSSFEECLQLNEVKSLRKIKHENVLRLLQVFRENERVYLVFELLNESLIKTINAKPVPFTDDEVRYTMKQLLKGLSIIHKQGFFHRDLKPDNLMWDSNKILKICDFGLAREIRSRPPFTEYLGTRWYRAPELVLRSKFYNSPVDIWAAGVIMAEMYLQKPLFPGNTETDQLFKICLILGTPTEQSWPDWPKLTRGMKIPSNPSGHLSNLITNACPEAINMIHQMLQFDPAKRPSANQLLSHEFFNGNEAPPPMSFDNESSEKTAVISKPDIPKLAKPMESLIRHNSATIPNQSPKEILKKSETGRVSSSTSKKTEKTRPSIPLPKSVMANPIPQKDIDDFFKKPFDLNSYIDMISEPPPLDDEDFM